MTPELWTTCPECGGNGTVRVKATEGFYQAECPLCNFGRLDCRSGLRRVPFDEIGTLWLTAGGGCDFLPIPGWTKCYYIEAAAFGEDT